MMRAFSIRNISQRQKMNYSRLEKPVPIVLSL